jgi:magnesium transporter
VGLVWFGSPVLGAVIAVAMVINLLVAGLAGILIPVALDRLGIDPALASGAFVTTVTDVVGFFAFPGACGRGSALGMTACGRAMADASGGSLRPG